MLRNNIKHKLTTILLSFAIAISGWLIPAQEAHAASYTITASGGYLYIPLAAGCPRVSSGRIYWRNDWQSHTYDYNSGYTKTHWYFVVSGAPEVVGSNVRYKLVGSYDDGWSHSDIPSGSWTYSPGDWYTGYNLDLVVSGSHSFPSGNTSAATCTSAATKKCTRCGAVQSVGSPLGHSYTVIQSAATCTTNQVNKCSRCSATQTIANTALGHSYTVKQSDATCTTNQVNKCSRCTATQQVTGTALGHLWDDGVPTPDATPYSTGIMTYTCQRNGTHQRTEAIPQKHFQIYSGGSRINKIYLGNTLIMNSSAGANVLVK